ncbi:MAG: leucyl aminopeptidase family protein [Rhodospirillaceae bacterium]
MIHLPLVEAASQAVPVTAVTSEGLEAWKNTQSEAVKAWLTTMSFNADAGQVCVISSAEGTLARALVGLGNGQDGWAAGRLSTTLPVATYYLDEIAGVDQDRKSWVATWMALAWTLGAYRFDRYKSKDTEKLAELVWPEDANRAYVEGAACAAILTRDLVNTPAEDMGPGALAAVAKDLAETYGAELEVTVGDDLLSKNLPAIHAVGRAADFAPRLIDLTWGDVTAPKVTLVGKGVCFDSGGLNIKPSSGMRLMKKDMGGAATVLGLADWIMRAQLPVRLRVLIPAVENAISGNAFRPGDVVTTRLGPTIEVGNTDAEGRVVLADALALACEESPDVIIDCATLTGAARVALGAELPALFSSDDTLARDLMEAGTRTHDPMWQLPLWSNYQRLIESKIADVSNSGESGLAGAITAALFLKTFVKDDVAWVHLDLFGWNPDDKPGRPAGGEAYAQRAIFDVFQQRYG